MREMLDTETRLTSRVGRLPDTYSFSKQGFQSDEVDMESIIFGGSEYVKDGLLAVSEWLGPCPWSDRMIGIVEDIFAHAQFDTPYGKIPTKNVEVNGEMLQALSRLYWFTGRRQISRLGRPHRRLLSSRRQPPGSEHLLAAPRPRV